MKKLLLLQKPKFNCDVHKDTQLVPVLSQTNPTFTPKPHIRIKETASFFFFLHVPHQSPCVLPLVFLWYLKLTCLYSLLTTFEGASVKCYEWSEKIYPPTKLRFVRERDKCSIVQKRSTKSH
jgi:hypothetical protein